MVTLYNRGKRKSITEHTTHRTLNLEAEQKITLGFTPASQEVGAGSRELDSEDQKKTR